MKKFVLLFVILCMAFGCAFAATSPKEQYIGDILQAINEVEKNYRQETDEEHLEEYQATLDESMHNLRKLVYKYAWYLVDNGEYDSEVLNIIYYVQLAIEGKDTDKNFAIARAILDTNSAYVTFKPNHS